MKHLVWLFSAVGLTVAPSVTNAQANFIKISSGSHSLTVQVERPVSSDAGLDEEINRLINSTASVNPLSYTTPAPTTQNTHLSNTNVASQVVSSASQNAPSVAASFASKAAHGKSIGRCAMYVRKALQAAGYKFTPQASAYMYANGTLKNAGFVKLSNEGYVPQVGDVAVFNRTSRNPHGHIQIYNGSIWVSDFRQNKFSPYSQHNGYTVWRDARYVDASNTQGTMLALNEH